MRDTRPPPPPDRARRARVLALVPALVLWLAWALAPQPLVAAVPAVVAVESVAMTVADAGRSAAFYRDVLAFEQVAERELAGADVERLYGVPGARIRLVRLRLGGEYLELEQFIAPAGRPMPADSRANDRWFQHVAIIVSDMDRAYARLREKGVRHASTSPQRLPDWNPAAGGISAFYFRDPDGHFLEILQFPPGKGDARWQEHAGRLFLGIDHTAIVVASTEDSLRHYRDGLGLSVAGTSENHGPEQERLNNVPGARLRITTLRAAAGPGIELLEYLAPRTGRPAPADTAANDLWSWHVNLRGGAGGEALFLRDPDGHGHLVRPAASGSRP